MALRLPRRVRTETVGRYRVFDVLRHEMRAADGAPLRDAYTFHCPDWVTVVPVTDAGDVLLVRQYRHGIDAVTLEVPGGVVDLGEAPADAARRELREETGCVAREWRSIGWTLPNPPLQDNRQHLFLAIGAAPAGPPEPDEDEECETVRMAPADLRAAIARGDVAHALVLVALGRAFEALRAAGAPGWDDGGASAVA